MDVQLALSKMKKYCATNSTEIQFCQLTTLRCGGTILLTVFPTSQKQLLQVAKLCKMANLPLCVLGNGSNVLASDKPFFGVVAVTKKLNKITVVGSKVVAQCGAHTTKLFWQLHKHGLCGGEFLRCLPATVGGAVVGNAGCFGQCMQNILSKVLVWHNGKVQWIDASQCQFSHRNSIFKHTHALVLAVEMQFEQGDSQQILHKSQQMLNKKQQSQPLNLPSAGSVLYHPTVCLSALLDKAGLKGTTIGGAQISTKHAGFVVNTGNATSTDVLLLIQHAQNVLQSRFGLQSNVEVQFVNF